MKWRIISLFITKQITQLTVSFHKNLMTTKVISSSGSVLLIHYNAEFFNFSLLLAPPLGRGLNQNIESGFSQNIYLNWVEAHDIFA